MPGATWPCKSLPLILGTWPISASVRRALALVNDPPQVGGVIDDIRPEILSDWQRSPSLFLGHDFYIRSKERHAPLGGNTIRYVSRHHFKQPINLLLCCSSFVVDIS